MEAKHRRTIWIGAGLLFILAVGSGYYPDVLLIREKAEAEKVGLLTVQEPAPVAADKDARREYDVAIRKNMPGLNRLISDPMKEARHPGPQVRALLDAVSEASRRPDYLLPKPIEYDPSVGWAAPATNVEANLETIAMAFATSAQSAEDLEAAARIARHLQLDEPTSIPSVAWGRIADEVLGASDRMHLTGAERTTVVQSLGKAPDPKASIRRHVAAVVAMVEKRSGKSGGRAQKEVRYLRFWRRFLESAPTEPRAFAISIKKAEPEMVSVEEALNVYPMYSASASANPWLVWANGLARVAGRM